MTLGRTSDNKIKIKTDGSAGLRAVSCGCCEQLLSCCSLTAYGAATGQYPLSALPSSFTVTWEEPDYANIFDENGLKCPVPYFTKSTTFTRNGTDYTSTAPGGGIYSVKLEDPYEDGNWQWVTNNFLSSDCFGVIPPEDEWGIYDFNSTNCDNFAFLAGGYNRRITYNYSGLHNDGNFPAPGWPSTVNFEWTSSCCEGAGTTTLTSINGIKWTGEVTWPDYAIGTFPVIVTCFGETWLATVVTQNMVSANLGIDKAGNWPLGTYYSGSDIFVIS